MRNKKAHNYSHTRLYMVWQGMKQRCLNIKHKQYKDYGGRGINVCEEWKNSYIPFHNWSIKNGYNPNAERCKCTLDRIDNDGDYCPENCKWVNWYEQQEKKRNCLYFSYKGVTKCLSEWARELKIERTTLRHRLLTLNLDVETAFSIDPKNSKGGRLCLKT